MATRSRVTPAVGSTIETRLPHMRFARVDLPTFGRPMIATRGRRLCAAVGIERSPSDGAPGQVRGGKGYARDGGWTTRGRSMAPCRSPGREAFREADE